MLDRITQQIIFISYLVTAVISSIYIFSREVISEDLAQYVMENQLLLLSIPLTLAVMVYFNKFLMIKAQYPFANKMRIYGKIGFVSVIFMPSLLIINQSSYTLTIAIAYIFLIMAIGAFPYFLIYMPYKIETEELLEKELREGVLMVPAAIVAYFVVSSFFARFSDLLAQILPNIELVALIEVVLEVVALSLPFIAAIICLRRLIAWNKVNQRVTYDMLYRGPKQEEDNLDVRRLI